MSSVTRIHVRENGSVTRPGVETPKGTKVVKRERDILTIKLPGSKYWVGIGVPHGYSPAEFQVYRVLSDGEEEAMMGSMRVEHLTSFPVKS